MINENDIVEDIVNLNLTLNILSIVNNYQLQNGIRNKDYERYINFCAKKINKIRKDFKITQGKRKFKKISIDEFNAKDSKLLLIQLLECERKWALASNYNKNMTELDHIVSDWRYKSKLKFKQASEEAVKLYNICKARADDQTILESEAYKCFLTASYNFYIRKFDIANDEYKKARDIYQNLTSKKDYIDALTYKDKINSINLQIRFCENNIKEKGKEVNLIFEQKEDEEEIIITKNVSLDTRNNHDVFEPNLYFEKSDTEFGIKINGSTIPIKNENVKNKLLKLEEYSLAIRIENDMTKKQNFFSDLFNLIDDCLKMTKVDKAEKSKDGENIIQVFNKIITYFTLLKINYQIWKTTIYLETYKLIFVNDNLILQILEKDNVKLQVKPQEIIKLYDNYIQYVNMIKTSDKEGINDLQFKILGFSEQVLNTLKIYYTSIVYLCLKKYEESYNLVAYFDQSWLEIEKTYELNKFSAYNQRDLDSLIKDGRKLKEFSKFLSLKIYARLNIDKNKHLLELTSKKNHKDTKENLENGVNKEIKIKCNSSLYSSIKGNKESINQENFQVFKDFSKIDYKEYKETIKNANFGNYSNIIQFPPAFQVLHPKPISFDILYNQLSYPDLKEKVKEKESKGILRSVFGLFGS